MTSTSWTATWCSVLAMAMVGCKFPYPADVRDDDAMAAPSTYTLGGTVVGLWTGGAVTLRLAAGDITEDIAARATEPFAFSHRVPHDTSYLVSIADDGPDHDCVVTNGSGRVMSADIADLAVSCTNLIPHSVAISPAVPFTFDPRVLRFDLPTSVLQQELSAIVTGPTLTAVSVGGQSATPGAASPPVHIAMGTSAVDLELVKGALSKRYELAFDRGAVPIAEAVYGRASNADRDDGFGVAVAASRDFVAVGAWLEDSSFEAGLDNGTTDSGAVYIYRRSGETWTFSQRLKGSAITATRRFGHALAIDDGVLIVGADGDDARGADAGAAYVFRVDATGRWAEQVRLVASDVRTGDQFGAAVAVSGGLVAIGSPAHDRVAGNGDDAGGVYTFHYDGASWVEEPVLRAAFGSMYGRRVALDGDALAMTAFLRDPVLVYRRSGTTWVPETLTNASGGSLDLDGDTLAVGEPFANSPGAVRLFARSGGAWTQSAYLQAAPPTGGSNLGANVGILGDIVVTSDSITPAQVFKRVGGTWIALPPQVASGSPAAVLGGGPAVAISGSGVVVGNPGDGGPGNTLPGSGTVWLFR